MPKQYFLSKKLKRQFLLLTESIQSYFKKINTIKFNLRNKKFYELNKIVGIFGILVILTLSFFLIPTLYNKDSVKDEIKYQILKKYKIKIKFNEGIKYSLFPKPHFVSNNISIQFKEKNIAEVEKFQSFISVKNFFSTNKINIKDLIFNKADFSIYKNDLLFFKNFLETKPNTNKIMIQDSKIFFKNKYDEIQFINKIKNSKFFYDSKNLENVLTSNNEIFNIPYKLTLKNDEFNKQVFFKFNSKKLRLKIENEFNYNDFIKNGLVDIFFVNRSSSFNYKIKKNSINFISENKKNNYSGRIDFKPFYFKANFNYDGISFKNVFNDDSIFNDLIKSEILNNPNLNAKIDIDIKDIVNIDELNELFLSVIINEGVINLSNSNILWKEDVKITLKESSLYYDDSRINLIGKFTIDFNNINNFYRSFQIKKNSRKKINKIEINFNYDLNRKRINFDNVKIDSIQNAKLEKYIDNFNKEEFKSLNKIIFKNFIKNFFDIYAG